MPTLSKYFCILCHLLFTNHEKKYPFTPNFNMRKLKCKELKNLSPRWSSYRGLDPRWKVRLMGIREPFTFLAPQQPMRGQPPHWQSTAPCRTLLFRWLPRVGLANEEAGREMIRSLHNPLTHDWAHQHHAAVTWTKQPPKSTTIIPPKRARWPGLLKATCTVCQI